MSRPDGGGASPSPPRALSLAPCSSARPWETNISFVGLYPDLLFITNDCKPFLVQLWGMVEGHEFRISATVHCAIHDPTELGLFLRRGQGRLDPPCILPYPELAESPEICRLEQICRFGHVSSRMSFGRCDPSKLLLRHFCRNLVFFWSAVDIDAFSIGQTVTKFPPCCCTDGWSAAKFQARFWIAPFGACFLPPRS